MWLVLEGESYFPLIERIHKRAWLHVASHWHAPTRQLAGPMSRCYRTDIGAPIWLQKALNNELIWASPDQLRRGEIVVPGEVAILPCRCPGELVGHFLHLPAPRQHGEIFVLAEPPVRPVQGTSWVAPRYCTGSANRSDFWI